MGISLGMSISYDVELLVYLTHDEAVSFPWTIPGLLWMSGFSSMHFQGF
jgi:hypothetical protein